MNSDRSLSAQRTVDFVVIAITVAVCLISFSALYAIYEAGLNFKSTVAKREAEMVTIANYSRTKVELPPAELNQRPQIKMMTVTPQAVADIKDYFDRMYGEYDNIHKYAVGLNARNHLSMFVEGLFPDTSRNPSKAFAARQGYLKALNVTFQPFSPTATYPQLDAKPPLTAQELRDGFIQAEKDHVNNELGILKPKEQLTAEEREVLQKKKTDKLMEMLMARAKSAHLYAETNPGATGFPFSIPAWTGSNRNKPSDADLWEGQMTLWIVSDIARVIAQTNGVDDPRANIMTAPIKRLLQMTVNPAYVGPVPAPKPDPLSTQYRPAFNLTSSGRAGNQFYDVRQVYLSMIVDWHQLPIFLDNLSKENFMSVLLVDTTDVDEYQALREGYYYGTTDAVKVDMLIETLWLREWTSKLMPQEVREARGVPPMPDAGPLPVAVPVPPEPH